MKTRVSKKQSELNILASAVYEFNKRMNDIKRQHDAARKKLFADMKESGLTSFEALVEIEGSPTTLSAVIESKPRNEIDIHKLARSVPMETFIECVTASVTTVEKVAGSAVASMCSIEGRTAENVTVKAK
jgi:hypothetical protein